MNAVKNAVRGVLETFFLFLLACVVIWFFFGKITVSATIAGETLGQATVEIDGERVCERTPCAIRVVPGIHILTVKPNGIETLEENIHWTLAAFNLGKKVVADFHEPAPSSSAIPPDQTMMTLMNTLDVSVGYVGVKDCVPPATSSVYAGPPQQPLCTIPARTSITTHLAIDGVKPYPVVMTDPK